MNNIKIMTIFGTRPEAIKMVPVIRALRRTGRFDTIVAITAQHREMLDQVLTAFDITADYDLDIMEKGQTLTDMTARIICGLRDLLEHQRPDLVLVHGDTTTTFAASLSAFYQKIPVGHVEAGLRTFDKFAPYPEEINRKLTGSLTDLHFAPTETAKSNLLLEGVTPKSIYVTGNTIIDILLQTVGEHDAFENERLRLLDAGKKTLLLTCHRRENLGQPMERIFAAISQIAAQNKDINIVFPVHLNHLIQEAAQRHLSTSENVVLTEPLSYKDLVNLMNKSHFVLTDSGGIQEEAAALGKPVLVLRDTTERGEGLSCGGSKIIGTQIQRIISETDALLHDQSQYLKMASSPNPYGDGKASERIAKILTDYFAKEALMK